VQTWSIFCRVVDNFGDIGVCWRLARQLAHEHPLRITLWVDDLASFAKIRAEINPNLAEQKLESVTIRHWSEQWSADIQANDVVIETFACDLPTAYIEQMRSSTTPPIWINLDYLSAEDWVSGCHGLPSPQQGLSKYFFFPGFNDKTGGLIGEQSMRQQRRAWQSADAKQLRQQLAPKRPAETADTQYISLFAYENSALNAWLHRLKDSPNPIHLFVPQGRVLPQITQLLMQAELHAGEVYQYGAVTISILPMLPQDQYDQLLWSCDLNFVRGEDSFVRAQWAGLPMAWQIYPQSEDTHLEKLVAFLQLYLADLPDELAQALRDFYYTWNQGGDIAQSWTILNTEREVLRQHAKNWALRLAAQGDLATNLVKFTQSKLK
jgi:uncharacterized repeat protein (TIGR03837 family)